MPTGTVLRTRGPPGRPPTSSSSRSHEDPAEILEIDIQWEGYGDDCLQMELYVWDDAIRQWCDGAGQLRGEPLHGQRRGQP